MEAGTVLLLNQLISDLHSGTEMKLRVSLCWGMCKTKHQK